MTPTKSLFREGREVAKTHEVYMLALAKGKSLITLTIVSSAHQGI